MFNNKIAKGIVSLLSIIILLSSILAGTLYYQNGITANVIMDASTQEESFPIKEVNGIEELNQLNEGWYKISNGYVYYFETFNSYIPIYIKVKNTEQQNGIFVVDENGNVEFQDTFEKYPLLLPIPYIYNVHMDIPFQNMDCNQYPF